MNDVSFAGNEWEVMFVYFIGERFSRISFANRYSTKAEAMKQFDKLHELFSNKYPLRKETFNGKISTVVKTRRYDYSYDANSRIVGVDIFVNEDPDPDTRLTFVWSR